MDYTIFKAKDRGTADFGWLKPNFYFSFGQYYNPERIHFGALRVLNDDFVAGGGGFPTHPHDNMEIVTIPHSGALSHKDSSGGAGVINAGDVQIMSAGSGIQHSEFNTSQTEPVTLFQLWVFPKEKNITPRYDQKTFDVAQRNNQWQVVVSPTDEDALWINQDAVFSLIDLEADKSCDYNFHFNENGVFLVSIEGDFVIGEHQLGKRDAIGIYNSSDFSITAKSNAKLLAVEVPMTW